MAAIASTSKIQGQIDAEDVSAGPGEVVAEGPPVVGTLVALVVDVDVDVVVEVDVAVDVDVVVDVDVDVTVEVFVPELDDEVGVFVDDVDVAAEDDVDVAMPVGGAVSEGPGVREGSAGRLTERDALGRFEPPAHAARSTRAIAQNAIDGRIRPLPIPYSFRLTSHLSSQSRRKEGRR